MPKFDIDGKSIALGLAHPRLVASVAIQSRWRVKLAKRRLALLRDPDAVEAAWEQYTDAQGYPYWYNTLTHESTYEKPLGFKLPGEMTDEEKQQAADRVARESEKARLETERLAAEKAEREADDNDKKAAEMIFQSLLLRVKSAAGLASADTFGKSDPYCKVFLAKGKFGDVLEIGRTVAVDNTANPEWDAMFELKLPEDLSTCTLTLEVFDEDAGITNALNKDDFLGRAVLGVGNIFEQDHTGGVCEHLLGPKPDLTKKQMKLVKGSVSISLEQKLNVEPNGALVVDIISASNVITDKLTKDQPSCAVNWRPVPGDYELVGTEKAVKASPNLEWEASFECGLPNDVRSADMILTLTQPRRMKQDLFLGTVALTGVDVLDYANRDTREYTLLGKDGVADKPRGSISLRFRTLDRDWATAPRALKPALPRWTRVKDPATGDCFYYFNGKGATVETGDEWSWERPQDFGWGGGDVVEGGDGGGSADNSGEAKDEREADDPGKEGKVDNKVGNDDDEEEGTEDTEDTTGPLGTGLCHPRLWASVRLEAWWRAHMLHMRTTRVFTKAGMAEARARERAKKAGLVWTPELARQVLPLHKKVKWPQAKKMGHLQSFALDPEAKPDLSSYASVNFLQTFGVDLNLPDKAPPTGMDYNFWQKDEEETKIAPKKPDKVRGELPMDIARAFFKDAAQYRANNRVKDDEAFTEFKDRYGSMVNGMAPQPALKRSAIHPSQVKNIQRVTQLLEAGGLPARYEPLRMPPGGWGDDDSDHSSMDSDDLGVNDFTRNFGY